VRFVHADAQIHRFDDDSIDALISRTGTMLFGDPVAAFTNRARALRPGARLAMLVWPEFAHNEWIRSVVAALSAGRDLPTPPPHAPGPFSMSDPDRVRGILTQAGFGSIVVEGVFEPMYFGHTARDAHQLIAGLTAWMLDELDEPARSRALHNLRTTIEAHVAPDEGVLFDSACWLVTATPA
jgi:SAM-dependent methyltransferase